MTGAYILPVHEVRCGLYCNYVAVAYTRIYYSALYIYIYIFFPPRIYIGIQLYIYLANDFVETSPRPKISRYVCSSCHDRRTTHAATYRTLMSYYIFSGYNSCIYIIL